MLCTSDLFTRNCEGARSKYQIDLWGVRPGHHHMLIKRAGECVHDPTLVSSSVIQTNREVNGGRGRLNHTATTVPVRWQHFSSNQVESACFLRLWVSSQNALETLFHEVPEFWMRKYKQFVLHDGVHDLLSNLVWWLT